MKRQDIHKVLIIGSGPIIIGQACEFDYSGTQACKALKKLGYEIVLVNSNPATIMTDPDTADITYIEPLNVERLEQIIEKERPDALLPNLGGQSGLNLCSELQAAGVLDKYNVKVIGVQVDAIERGEDRIEFKNTMNALGVEMARSDVAYSVDEALAIADKLGYPVVLRPAYTMGGAGGGLVYNKEELKTVCARGLQASLVGQVLVEESILGWEELELEVVRDAKGNMITVCFIENIDPVGVHTGDSFCSAPMLTISEEVQKKLQDQAACQCSDKTGFYPGGTFLIHRTEQQEGIQHKPVAVVCLADHAVSEANRQNCAETKRETSLKCIRLYLAKQFLKRAAIAGKLPTVRTLFSAILPNIIQNQQEEAEKILNEYTGNFIALLNLGQKLAACSNQFLLLKSIGSGSLHILGQAFQQVMPVRI